MERHAPPAFIAGEHFLLARKRTMDFLQFFVDKHRGIRYDDIWFRMPERRL
jgi:hypothetical protein